MEIGNGNFMVCTYCIHDKYLLWYCKWDDGSYDDGDEDNEENYKNPPNYVSVFVDCVKRHHFWLADAL